MEEFAISIRFKSFKRPEADDKYLGGPCADSQLSAQSLCFPKGMELPACLRQKPASETLAKIMSERKVENVCYVCKAPTLAKKYKCPSNGHVSCSFPCYKQTLLNP